MFFLGNVRRFLFIKGTYLWNAWVRDITAWLEIHTPWLIGSKEIYLCPDCGVKPGNPHKEECDVERCSICRGQKLTCGCIGNDTVLENWMGVWPE